MKIIKCKRIIAILLVLVMALPVIQPCSVRAETDTDTDSLVTKIVNQYKASKDAEMIRIFCTGDAEMT